MRTGRFPRARKAHDRRGRTPSAPGREPATAGRTGPLKKSRSLLRQPTELTYPQVYNQKPGLGFPIARLGAVISLACGAVVNLGFCCYAGKGQGEVSLLRRLWDVLGPGDVLLADSLIANWANIAFLRERGIELVSRLNKAHRTADWLTDSFGSPNEPRPLRARLNVVQEVEGSNPLGPEVLRTLSERGYLRGGKARSGAASHTSASPSRPPEISRRPSALNARLMTYPW